MKPIESMKESPELKCFTYFHEKQLPKANYHVKIDDIKIFAEFPYQWFPYDLEFEIWIAIHSPNVMPPLDTFFKFKQAVDEKLFFSKVEEKRLINYDNCRVYNISENDFETRIDCLDNCFFNSIKSQCHGHFTGKIPFPLFRNQYPSYKKDILSRECMDLISYKALAEICGNICQEDCHQAYYLTTVEKKLNTENSRVLQFNIGIRLQIETNSNPNILIEHFAEITFISLFCNFGGLLGMYLGISLQTVTQKAIEISEKLLMKINFFNIKNNNQNIFVINRPNIMMNNLVI